MRTVQDFQLEGNDQIDQYIVKLILEKAGYKVDAGSDAVRAGANAVGRGLAEDVLDDVDPRDKRVALPDSDIEKILNSEVITNIIQRGLPIKWTGTDHEYANKFWLLMILITTGMRLSEACQLLETDIHTGENGIIYFSLLPEKKTKKTKH